MSKKESLKYTSSESTEEKIFDVTIDELEDPIGLFQLMGFIPDPNNMKEYYYSFEDYAAADWKAVGERLCSHPDEASAIRECTFFQRERQHPLQCALNIADKPVPPHILNKLIQAHPQAVFVNVPKLAHLAFTNYNIPSESIKILLHANKQLACAALHNGKLPLHISSAYESSKQLIHAHPQAMATPDDDRCIPLYYAITSESPAHVKLLLEEGMNHSVEGDHGAGGLFYLNKRRQSSLDVAFQMARAELGTDTGDVSQTSFYSKRQKGFEKLCLCLQACAASKLGHDCHSPKANLSEHPALHATIEFATSFKIIEHACQICASDLNRLDRLGRTALSVAIDRWNDIQFDFPSSTNNDNLLDDYDETKEILQNRHRLIQYLCNGTNACSIPDDDGTLPLNKLLSKNHSSTYNQDIIQEFLKNAPMSISTRDISSHFYPFMTAATEKMTRTKKETPKIDAVFNLLLENPALLRQYTME